MAFGVVLSREADGDLEDIYRYVAMNDSVRNAERLVTDLVDACRGVARFPERGNVPKELRESGARAHREVHRGPYRIIYRVVGRRVIIDGVFDGRRDMQTLLQRSLLR